MKHDPAFPIVRPDGDWNPGLTKREYFAALAMQGLLSNDAAMQMIAHNAKEQGTHPAHELSKTAVMFADGVLAKMSPLEAVQ